MSGLGPEARRLLLEGGDAGEPDDVSLARARAALMARVGAVAAASGVAVSSAKAIVSSGTSATVAATHVATGASTSIAPAAIAPLAAIPFAAKVVAMAAIALGVGVVYRSTTPSSPPQRPSITRVAEPDHPDRPTEPAPPVAMAKAPAVPEPAAPPATTPSPTTVKSDETIRQRRVDPPLAQQTVPAAQGGALAGDARRLSEAQAALLDGRPEDALRAADGVDPQGPLGDEREGVRILAACALGSPNAGENAREFVAAHPRAALSVRVRAACLGSP